MQLAKHCASHLQNRRKDEFLSFKTLSQVKKMYQYKHWGGVHTEYYGHVQEASLSSSAFYIVLEIHIPKLLFCINLVWVIPVTEAISYNPNGTQDIIILETHTHIHTVGWVGEREREKLFYCKALAHAIMEPEKSKVCSQQYRSSLSPKA